MREIRLTATLGDVIIKRAHNGWVLHTTGPYGMGSGMDPASILEVAETPNRLAEIITAWAKAQQETPHE